MSSFVQEGALFLYMSVWLFEAAAVNSLWFLSSHLLHLPLPVYLCPSRLPLYLVFVSDSFPLRRLQKRSGQMVSDDFRALLIATGNSLVLLLMLGAPQGVCRAEPGGQRFYFVFL